MNRFTLLSGAAVSVMCLTAAPVCAQEQAPPTESAPEVRRPFRGLFDVFGGPRSPNSPHSLVVSASLFAAYDDNVLEGLTSRRVRRPWLQQSGGYQGATAGANYGFGKKFGRADFQGGTGAHLRYYHHGETSRTLPSWRGDVSMGMPLSRSLTFGARQSFALASNYNRSLASLALDGDEFAEAEGHDIALPEEPDLDLFGVSVFRSTTSLRLSQRFGRNTSLSGGYHLRSLSLLDEETEEDPPAPDSGAAGIGRLRGYRSQAGSVRLQHSRHLTRNAELQLGYGIRISDGRTGEPRVMHDIIAGVNYSRALSISRRTSISFGTGSSISVQEQVNLPESDPRTRARLVGRATLAHEIGRSWTAQLSYVRGYRAHDGFGDLYFTDGASASIGGLFNRRWSFSASSRFAVSEIEGRGRGGHRGTSVTAQSTYALNRFAGLFVSYVYYHYRYDDDLQLDPRLARQLDRNGVRVGLTTSFPLIR